MWTVEASAGSPFLDNRKGIADTVLHTHFRISSIVSASNSPGLMSEADYQVYPHLARSLVARQDRVSIPDPTDPVQRLD